MVQRVGLSKVIYLFAILLTMIIACLFSNSLQIVSAEEECCSSSSPHLITELGVNAYGGSTTSFNYYARQGLFSEYGHYFKQEVDIFVSDGNSVYQTELNSTYNGNDKTFKLKDDSPAMFSLVGGTLSNLNVECKKTSGEGIIAGVTNILTGKLEKVSYTGEINISSGVTCIGGLVGQNDGGTVRDCRNLGDIKYSGSTSANIGGIVGEQFSGNIYSSYNWGNIEVTLASNSNAGGIVGNIKSSVIRNCYNSASVYNTGNGSVGGLVGKKSGDDKFSLIQNYSIGTIGGSSSKGALIGWVESNKIDTYNLNFYLKFDKNIYSCGNFAGLVSSDAIGKAKTESEFSNNSTFAGWLLGFKYSDFSSWVWHQHALEIEIDGNITTKKLPRLSYENLQVLTPHTVTFNKNHPDATGEMVPQELFEEKAYPLNENKFERTGYKISGWSTSPDGVVEYQDKQAITIDKDITLYVVWKYEYTYKLTFDPNGGECLTEYKYVHTGLNIGELPIPTRTGYTFLGWVALDIQESTLTPETKFTLKKDVTATAGWEEITYTINYFDQPISEGGAYTLLKTITTLTYTAEFNHPTKENLNLTPRTDSVAVGFSLEKVALENLTKFGEKVKVSDFVTNREITEIDIYVQYTNSKYTLTLDATPGTFSSSGESEKQITVTYGEALSNLDEIPVRTGYRVESWQLYDATEDGSSITITKDTVWSYLKNLTAKPVWKANNYTVNFYRNETSGETPFHTETCIYDANPPYEFPEVTREGFTFKGYSTYTTGEEVLQNSKPDSENKTYNFATENGGVINLYAIWEENQYTLRYYVNNELVTFVQDSTETHKYSDEAHIKTNEEFFGGSGGPYILKHFNTSPDGTGASYELGADLTKKIKENKTIDLYAIYYDTVQITVTKHSDSPNVGCSGFTIESEGEDTSSGALGSCYMYIIKGRSVTITADIFNGYGMVGWYDANGTRKTQSKSYTFTASTDATYYAKWEQIIFKCKCDGCLNDAQQNSDYCSNCLNNWCDICDDCGLHNTEDHKMLTITIKSWVNSSNKSAYYVNWGSTAGTTNSLSKQVHIGTDITIITSKASTAKGSFSAWRLSSQSGTSISTSTSTTISADQSKTIVAVWNCTYICNCCSAEIAYYDYGYCSTCSTSRCSCCGTCQEHSSCDCSFNTWCSCCGGYVCDEHPCGCYSVSYCYCCGNYSCYYHDNCSCYNVSYCSCCQRYYCYYHNNCNCSFNYCTCCELTYCNMHESGCECYGTACSGCGQCEYHCSGCVTCPDCGGDGGCKASPVIVDSYEITCSGCGRPVTYNVWQCPGCGTDGYNYYCAYCYTEGSTDKHNTENPRCGTCGGDGFIRSRNMGSSTATDINSKKPLNENFMDYEYCLINEEEKDKKIKISKYEAVLKDDEE